MEPSGTKLPISEEILRKRSEIPRLIAQLSYLDEKLAIHYLRLWGERKAQISILHQELLEVLKGKTNE